MPLMRKRTRVLASFLLVLFFVAAGLFKSAGGAAEPRQALHLSRSSSSNSNPDPSPLASAPNVVDSDVQVTITQETNKAFVLMQYFGYLRRNPNDPPDSDHTGYDFWLTKLNDFNGNFVNAEMVKAFLDSIEYRQRF